MAVKIPLVITDGQIEQLQTGDAIAGTTTIERINNNGSPITICQAVYPDDNGDVDLAKADAAATKDVIGFVVDASIASAATGEITIGGLVIATTGQWDAVTGDAGGLTVNTIYYLSAATAGSITTTAPTATSQFTIPVGIALSTTEMLIINRHSVLL